MRNTQQTPSVVQDPAVVFFKQILSSNCASGTYHTTFAIVKSLGLTKEFAKAAIIAYQTPNSDKNLIAACIATLLSSEEITGCPLEDLAMLICISAENLCMFGCRGDETLQKARSNNSEVILDCLQKEDSSWNKTCPLSDDGKSYKEYYVEASLMHIASFESPYFEHAFLPQELDGELIYSELMLLGISTDE